MRIAVLGAGGVGGYLGARIGDAGAAEVHLLARGAHLAALQRDGLELRSIDGDCHVELPATDDPAEVGPVDVVLFTVKSNDTGTAGHQLAPLLHEGTAVVTFQNGVDNERRLVDIVGEDHVLGGAAFVFVTVAEPGVLEHTGGPTRFVFGELDGQRRGRAERFLAVCKAAGIDAVLSGEIRRVLWRKYALMCATGGMTAASRLPVGALRADAAAWGMFRRIAEEVCALAAAEGVELPDNTVDRTVRLAEGFEPDSYSSLHHDLTHGRPMELGALNGTAVRLGRRHGMEVPMNEAVHALLSPWAARHARS